MTKEETKQAIAVMQAYVDGKTVERQVDHAVVDDPSWNWGDSEGTYRISPEPTLRPWTPVEAAAHLGRNTLDKRTGSRAAMILSVGQGSVRLRRADLSVWDLTYEELAASRALTDGQPCGVLVQPD